VAKHNSDGDSWIIVRDGVYDVSKFAAVHPAGKKVILAYAGRDASEDFFYFHEQNLLTSDKYLRLRIGTLREEGE
jgi:cytochrome b involved in lipid metabolism